MNLPQRLRRLEQIASPAAGAAEIVEVCIPDNGRGLPRPGRYLATPGVVLYVYAVECSDENPTEDYLP